MAAPAQRPRLTVQDLLDEPELGLTLVAGRQGVGRQVGGVHISEMPDPTPWLAPRDVLLTTGLSLKGDTELQRSFVQRLSEAGIAALGFAAGITMEGAPPTLRETAEEVGLPLFEVSYRTPFKKITSYIFAGLLSQDMHRLRRSLSVQDHLLSLLVEEKGADHLVSSLSMLLSATIVLFDAGGRVVSLARNRVRVDDTHAERVWRAYTEAARSGGLPRELALDDQRIVFREVRRHGRIQRVLALCLPAREHLLEFADIVLTYAQKLLALDLLKSRDTLLLQRKIRADLLDELLSGSGDQADLAERLRFYQIEAEQPLRVLIVEAPRLSETKGTAAPLTDEQLQESRNEIQDAVETVLADRRLPTLAMSRGDAVIALIQPGRESTEQLRRIPSQVRSHLAGQAADLDLTLGASDPFTGVEGSPRAYAQAREASRLARTGAHGSAIVFADLGPSIRSLENQSEEHLRLFYEATIRPLEAHDAAHGDELVRTLAVYLEEERSVSRAARRLFVHQNTLRYRLKKIESILSARLSDTETLVDLFLGLRSRTILQDRSPTPPRSG